ncbi:hypothetical protein RD792_013285 [Penstemon davidsonii]|uniref:Protein kinase domain-containing protein n=1 Tax=Penstemon davidsonii TaxID=160366 RepID=A0ABR0CUK7_9LAMI|nr:hypothetical protein RD792_013285 [Penstemon davidsonii]
MNCFPCFTKKESNDNVDDNLPVAQVKDITSQPPPVHNINKQTPSADASNKAEAHEAEDGNGSAKTFTFRELASATKNFRQECLLGEGGFGRVFRGTLQSSGQIVAVRQLDRSGTQGSKDFLVEVMMLSLLHHPNLVDLIGYCADGDQRLLVYEYMPSGSLRNHLFDLPADKKPLDWSARMKIASGIAEGLEYLHEKANPPIIYRDLKSSNVLLDEKNNPRLSEYGLAKLVQSGNTMHITPRVLAAYGYSAPEFERHGELTLKSDVYSFGVVLLELITGRRALDTTQPTDEQNLVSWAQPIFREPSRFPDMADPLLKSGFPVTSLNQAVGIAAMCLQEEPSVRPLISDVVAALSFLALAPPEAPIPARLVPILSARVEPSSVHLDHHHSTNKGNISSHKNEESSGSEDEEDQKIYPNERENDDGEEEDDESSDYESSDSSVSSHHEKDNSGRKLKDSEKCESSSKHKSKRKSLSSSSRSSRHSSIGSRDYSLGFSLRCDSSYPERNLGSNSRQDVIHESQEYEAGSSSDDESSGDENSIGSGSSSRSRSHHNGRASMNSRSKSNINLHNESLTSNISRYSSKNSRGSKSRQSSNVKSEDGDISTRRFDNVELSMRSDDGSEVVYSRNSSNVSSENGDHNGSIH